MKTTLGFVVAVAVALSSGCVMVKSTSKRTGSSSSALTSGGHDCAPHQYWDGTICRHKGKGSGARKHDG